MPLISVFSVGSPLCLFHHAPPPLLSSLCQPVTSGVRGVSPRAWAETEGRSGGSRCWGSTSKEEMKSCCVLVIYQYKTPIHTDSSHYSGCVFLIKFCCFASKYIEVYFFSQYLSLLTLSCLLSFLYLPHSLFSCLCLLQPFLGLWATFTYSFSHIQWLTHLS